MKKEGVFLNPSPFVNSSQLKLYISLDSFEVTTLYPSLASFILGSYEFMAFNICISTSKTSCA